MKQTAVQAFIKTNKCNLTQDERFSYRIMYITSLVMANHAAREMRQFTGGRDKQILGQEMTNRSNRLKQIASIATKQGASKIWEESAERLQMRADLVAKFSIMLCRFDDDDETLDYFFDKITLLELQAKNELIHGKRN